MVELPPPRRLSLPPLELPDGRREPGIDLSVHESGEGLPVVLCHGFPELAYSWRHQLAALAAAGFRAIAPDQRGYGASDRPEAVEAYDMHHLCGDLVGLLDALGLERAVFVGHDWGGFVAWAMPILHPERCAGVVGVNTPYMPRSPVPPTQMMRALVGGQDEKLYILWFQQPGVAERVLDAHTRRVFEVLMRRGAPPEEVAARMSAEEIDVYVEAFERTGFAGGIHWYRNFDRNWETAPEVGQAKIEVPSLMVTAAWDMALRPEMAAGMPSLVVDLETVQIERCGHWTQQEQPEQLNAILVDWLSRRFA